MEIIIDVQFHLQPGNLPACEPVLLVMPGGGCQSTRLGFSHQFMPAVLGAQFRVGFAPCIRGKGCIIGCRSRVMIGGCLGGRWDG